MLQADIVHTFLLTASLYGRLAAMMARVPIIIGTEVNIYEQKNPWHIKAERWLMGKTDRVVVSAESVRDFYVEQVGADPRSASMSSITRLTGRNCRRPRPATEFRARLWRAD